jgi:hypothetical protein
MLFPIKASIPLSFISMGSITFQIEYFYAKSNEDRDLVDQLPQIIIGTFFLIVQGLACYLLITYYKIQIVTSLN